MSLNLAFDSKCSVVGKQYEGRKQMPLDTQAEIAAIVKSEYRRERLGDKEVYLCSPRRLRELSESGSSSLTVNPQYELKKDMAQALSKFSPVERRIIFRVLIQGQSLALATKHSKFSYGYWYNWLHTNALPALRKSLSDYHVNGKVVIS
jgi:hypothetical protein